MVVTIYNRETRSTSEVSLFCASNRFIAPPPPVVKFEHSFASLYDLHHCRQMTASVPPKGAGKRRLRIKVISLGDASSGKSCIIKRYCEKRFVPKYMQTIGIDYGVTKFDDNGTDVRVNIFDFAGHPIFYEVRNEFYRDAQGVILVYDVTNRESFRHLDDWLLEMRKFTCETDSFIVAVCANKTDASRRVVTEEAGREFAEKKGFLYFELSAYSGKGINEMFSGLFADVVKSVRFGKTKLGSVNLGYTRDQADIVAMAEDSVTLEVEHRCYPKLPLIGSGNVPPTPPRIIILTTSLTTNRNVPHGLLVHPDGEHLIYPLGCTVVVENIKTNEQSFFTGHTNDVSCLAVSKSGRFVASGQITHMGFKADVIVWDFQNKGQYY
eukprot:sb/3465671/